MYAYSWLIGMVLFWFLNKNPLRRILIMVLFDPRSFHIASPPLHRMHPLGEREKGSRSKDRQVVKNLNLNRRLPRSVRAKSVHELCYVRCERGRVKWDSVVPVVSRQMVVFIRGGSIPQYSELRKQARFLCQNPFTIENSQINWELWFLESE